MNFKLKIAFFSIVAPLILQDAQAQYDAVPQQAAPVENGVFINNAEVVSPMQMGTMRRNASMLPEERQAIMAERMQAYQERQFQTQQHIEESAQTAADVIQTQNATDDAAKHQEAEEVAVQTAEVQAPIVQKTPRELLVDSLLERNPFFAAQSRKANGAMQQAPKGLELRSITCLNGKWFFGITDTIAKKNYVVPLGRNNKTVGIAYVVDFYDDETNSISVSDAIGCYTLTLKEPDAPTGKAVPMHGAAAKSGAKPNRTAIQRRATLRR